MHGPPLDPRYRPPTEQLTWKKVLASYATMAAIPVALWVVSRPLAGTAALAAVVGLVVVGRRAYRLARCFHDCRGFTIDLGGKARVTVAQIPTDEAN